MQQRRGFVIRELMLYLMIGSVLLMVSLNLFRAGWICFQSIRRLTEVRIDFINVSERLKIDLYRDIREIIIGRESFTFSFLLHEGSATDQEERSYTFLMKDNKLCYSINNGTSETPVTLSGLVRSVAFETEPNLLHVTFDYGDYRFRRTYRLDHIQKQGLLNGLSDDFAIGLRHQCRVPDADSVCGPPGELFRCF